jgi:hypothetical protein
MQKSRDILLSLVRSALWNVPVSDVPSGIQWDKVCRLASQQTLVGLLADGIRMLPAGCGPEDKLYRQLQAYVVRNIQAHNLITERLGRTLQVLREEGMEPVLLKGHGLAQNYPDPMSRQCGDIDLYVGREEYMSAVDVCLDRFGPGEHELENLKHYHFDNQGVTVELHKIAAILPSFFRNRRFQKWSDSCLDASRLRKAIIEGVEVSLPPHRFDVIYVMVHAWDHFLNGGIGLRQICDWTVYVHKFHDVVDAAALEEDLRSFGLLKVWHLFSWIAVNRLGLPAHECPLYDGRYAGDAERMMDIIWSDGNFGRYSERSAKRPEGYMRGKLHSLHVTTARYLRIIPVYPLHILNAWSSYVLAGIYQYFKGLFR